MNKEFLLEIGTEELPACEIEPVILQLKSIFTEFLETNKINYTSINTYATSRRQVVYIKNLAEKQQPVKKTIVGPPKDKATDKALLGFLKKYNLKKEALTVKKLEKGEYIIAEILEEGKSTKKLLEENLPILIKKLKFSKTMRWTTGNLYFSRPIRWILCLFDKEIINFDLDGIKSKNFTFGHKLLAYKKIKLSSAEEYFDRLKENYVVVDQYLRLHRVRLEIEEYQKEGLYAKHADLFGDALKLLVYPLEYPAIIKATLPENYHLLPEEVVTTILYEQKCIPLFSETKLSKTFLIIANTALKYSSNIRIGFENQIEAKIQDALFFLEEDKQKDLPQLIELQKGIIFHEKLGNIYDKSQRIAELSYYVADCEDKSYKDIIKKAAYLSKVDLTTSMVFEYPQLQGIMGYYYAKNYWGVNETVSTAIKHHYERMPKDEKAAILSIADKLDTIVAFFSINIFPSGSQDPYGLRRLIQDLVCTIIFHRFKKINLRDLINYSMNLLKIQPNKRENLLDNTLSYLKSRIYFILTGQIILPNFNKTTSEFVAKSVLETDEDNPWKIILKAEELEKVGSRLFDLVLTYKRINNITKNLKEKKPIREDLLIEPQEKRLYDSFLSTKTMLENYLQREDYRGYIHTLLGLKPIIDEFFDNVLVMAEDKNLMHNRQALLLMIKELFLNIADFSVFKI
jgi:glycyl-tRNA synthetase beta chain